MWISWWTQVRTNSFLFFSNKYKLYIKLFWKRNNLFTYFRYLIIKTLSHVKYLHVIVKHYSVWVWFKHKVDLSAIYSVGIIAIVISVWLTIDILCRQDANSNEPAMIITLISLKCTTKRTDRGRNIQLVGVRKTVACNVAEGRYHWNFVVRNDVQG